jgi:hypothetical protein
MDLGYVIIINDFNNINNLASVIKKREVFINGSFVEKQELIIAVENYSKEIIFIDYDEIKMDIKKISSFSDYLKINKLELNKIKEYLLLNKISVSWLEEIQINELNKVNNNISECILQLQKFYDVILEKNTKSSFLDY